MADNSENCAICEKSLKIGSETVTIRKKGCIAINEASKERGASVTVTEGQKVHSNCRRDFCNKFYIEKAKRKISHSDESTKKRLRSHQNEFNYKHNCLFCGEGDKYKGKKPEYKLIAVRTKDFQDNIHKICDQRNDEWSQTVLSRIIFAQDLHAADAQYHQKCSINFRTLKQIPCDLLQVESEKALKTAKVGRPEDNARSTAFQKVITYLEDNCDVQTSITALIAKMRSYLAGNQDPYGYTYMKKKLIENFEDRIVITELSGKETIVTLKSTAEQLLHEFYSAPKMLDTNTEKLRLIETAAKLIQNDIKSLEADCSSYPSSSELGSMESNLHFVPTSLKHLLKKLFSGKNTDLKIASVGQAIMQATVPRTITAPLQIGLAVQLHHHFSSRFLIDSLNKHGFCSSYTEVQKFEKSAAVTQGINIPAVIPPNSCVQFVADNVDHNVRTLDGFNTFHGMGMIVSNTPVKKPACKTLIPMSCVQSTEILQTGHIPKLFFKGGKEHKATLVYNALPLDNSDANTMQGLDVLWKSSLLFSRSSRPAWNGMMQTVLNGGYPGKSGISFLPMIDMNPSDINCVFTTLSFICDQAKKYTITPIITFDQPLWWKALQIIQDQPPDSDFHQIVLRLGAFHMEMSFLGAIGNIMKGAGLQEVLELIYANNAVTHMLSGKAVARAVRGHFIVDAALNCLLISKSLAIPVQTTAIKEGASESDTDKVLITTSMEQHAEACLLKEAEQMFTELLDGKITPEEVNKADIVQVLLSKILETKTSVENSRTAMLWLQYMHMIDVLRKFITGERTGDWNLHLQSVKEMLPYFAASGHSLYAKSARVYLQQMIELETKHPDVHRQFSEGYHVMRRSDRFWAGLSSDLVIEQVLMRSMKTTGGLTRGRGMTEMQRLIWLMSMPACAEINAAMQDITSINYQSSEQHKDMTRSRQERDTNDTKLVLNYLLERNPFTQETSLLNIVNGAVAKSNVNVDKAKEIGETILQEMTGNNVFEYSFKRKAEAVTFCHKSTVKVGKVEVQVDPQLLFQRLITAGERTEDLPKLFEYELCSYPAALFEDNNLMRAANKPALADAIWSRVQHIKPDNDENPIQYVLDGGSLLHKIPWSGGTSYQNICDMYVRYVLANYDKATIVFDGYEDGPSIKDATHRRRTGSKMHTAVKFTGSMIFHSKKDEFLSNTENKQRFINLLSTKLEESGCKILHAKGDADVLIVLTAIEMSTILPVVVVGEDTDLLILLLFHFNMDNQNITFQPQSKKSSKNPRTWDIKNVKQHLGPFCSLLLFAHAFLGCDTTSRIFGIGKGAAMKKLENNTFKEQAQVFNKHDATKEEISSAGEKAFITIYGGTNENLNQLRYERFCEKVSVSTAHVEPHQLPPTSSAARYHSFRVYLQVQQWMGRSDLNPTEWGWLIKNEELIPVQSDLPPAPEYLLEMIHCKCKKGCTTMRCTCKRHGMFCSSACVGCKSDCRNCDISSDDSDDDNV